MRNVQLPNGVMLENIPESVSKEDIQAKAIKAGLAKAEDFVLTPEKKVTWTDRARSSLQGLTFGFGDEITAGLVSMPAALSTGDSISDVYKDIRDSEREQQKDYITNNPREAVVTELAGGLLTGGVGAAKILGTQTAKKLPSLIKLPAVGAAEGAVYGVGTGEDTQDRIDKAKTGAVIGAVAAPVVGAVGKHVVEPVASVAKNALTSTPITKAKDLVRRAIESDGVNESQVIEAYESLGSQGLLGDISTSARNIVRDVRSQSPVTANIARDVLEARQQGSSSRLGNTLSENTGKNADNFDGVIKEISDSRQQSATPHYEKAWKEGVITKELYDLAISRPSLRLAIKRADSLAEEAGESIQSDFQKLHYAKMDLDKQWLKSRGTPKGRLINETRKELLNLMDDASPNYKQARDFYAGQSELLEAAKMGEQILKLKPREIDDFLESLSESERDLFKHGAVKAVVDSLDDIDVNADAAKKIIGKPSMQKRLRSVFDYGEEADNFIKQALAEREMSETRRVVLGGSQTTDKQQGIEQLTSMLGDPNAIAANFIQSMLGRSSMNDDVAEAFNRIMLNSNLTAKDIKKIGVKDGHKLSPLLGDGWYGYGVPITEGITQ